MAPSSPHALVVPGSGQGHINGCMLLAKSLSSLGFSISFVYFSTTYDQLKQKNRLSPPLPNIEIHVVPDGIEPNSSSFPFLVTPTMSQGVEHLVEILKQEGRPVTCIVSDSFVPWTQDVADKFGLPRIDYWTSTAVAYLMITNIPLLYANGILPDKGSPKIWRSENPVMVDCIPGLPPIPLHHYPNELRFAPPDSPFAKFFEELGLRMKTAERILIHTVHQLEVPGFEAYRFSQIPAYAIGPLFDEATSKVHDGATEDESLKWLDKQADSSVIYVAFGSHVSLSEEEIKELGCGLEASAQPFLWVIRSDVVKGELSDVLPEGFLERTKERGLIISWASQVEVLAHPAVGGFLTHCGWNSTMESLYAGVAMIGCPRGAEQRSNVDYIAQEWKVGLEMERREDGSLCRDHVEKAIRALMQEPEGEEARKRVKDLMHTVRKSSQEGGSSRANLQKFYDDMQALVRSSR